MTFEKYSVAFFMHKNQTKLEIFNVHRRDFVFFLYLLFMYKLYFYVYMASFEYKTRF